MIIASISLCFVWNWVNGPHHGQINNRCSWNFCLVYIALNLNKIKIPLSYLRVHTFRVVQSLIWMLHYAPINVFLQRGGGVAGIQLPKQSLLTGIWRTTLAQGRKLRCFGEKISKQLCLNLKARPGDFWHKIVSHGQGIRPKFFKIV